MASRLAWLQTCKLNQLQAIALATGINSSGTKAAISSQIQDGLSQFHNTLPSAPSNSRGAQRQQQRKDEYNTFSIDMGIRNLAYCQLVLPPSWLHHNSSSSPPTTPVTPTLLHWARIDVSKPADTQPPTTIATKQNASAKESFTPSTYAPHAHTFLATHILPHNPTHILIERQRFRSMGGAAVQEWTLRVNMFEAMLYATLHAYSALGLWKGEIVPIIPNKVNKYWIDGEDHLYKRKGALTRDVESKNDDVSIAIQKRKATKTTVRETSRVEDGLALEVEAGEFESKNDRSRAINNSKPQKMLLVREILKSRAGFNLAGEAKEVGEMVIGNAEGKRGTKRKNGRGREKGLGKFDDLADCLLQGLAWVKWEENKHLVWEKGLEALDQLRNRKGSARRVPSRNS
ncbi:MAG: hypothetical protein Q9166_002198 [cf. Caloplaca sp. 2 TL-2023]